MRRSQVGSRTFGVADTYKKLPSRAELLWNCIEPEQIARLFELSLNNFKGEEAKKFLKGRKMWPYYYPDPLDSTDLDKFPQDLYLRKSFSKPSEAQTPNEQKLINSKDNKKATKKKEKSNLNSKEKNKLYDSNKKYEKTEKPAKKSLTRNDKYYRDNKKDEKNKTTAANKLSKTAEYSQNNQPKDEKNHKKHKAKTNYSPDKSYHTEDQQKRDKSKSSTKKYAANGEKKKRNRPSANKKQSISLQKEKDADTKKRESKDESNSKKGKRFQTLARMLVEFRQRVNKKKI